MKRKDGHYEKRMIQGGKNLVSPDSSFDILSKIFFIGSV